MMALSAKQDDGDDAVVLQKIVLAAGTYDGVLASWELSLHQQPDATTPKNNSNSSSNKLKMVLASPVHSGSIRSLALGGSKNNNNSNGPPLLLLLSTGYDECLKTHDFSKGLVCCGEVRTPTDFGTPVCSAFCPPDQQSTHCLVGFGGGGGGMNSSSTSSTATTSPAGATTAESSGGGGKLVIYKKRDWSIQHVLVGHEGGVGAVSVHPTGKLAVTGGWSDGKLKVWDLERGRLAYSSSTRTVSSRTTHGVAAPVVGRKQQHCDAIVSIVWSTAGDCYAFCYGSHVTVRDVATGQDLLDVDLPSRVNQICLLEGNKGMFVAAACNDGSLPVLAVESCGDDDDDDDDVEESSSEERRAIMAIEPVDGPIAAEERFKCIQTVTGYYVATANSAGVVSLMDLEGAVNMIMSNNNNNNNNNDDDDDDDDGGDNDEETPVRNERVGGDDDDQDDDVELAVDIIDSVQLGTGARITCLAAWASLAACSSETGEKETSKKEAITETSNNKRVKHDDGGGGGGGGGGAREVVMDSAALEKARALVSKAKKIQKRKSKKKHKLGGRRR